MSSASPSSIILQKPQIPPFFSLLHPPLPAISAHRSLRFPSNTRTFLAAASLSPSFPSRRPYDAVAQPQPEEEEEEDDEPSIGDCLVFEDGIFDDPFLQDSPKAAVAVPAPVPARSHKSSRRGPVKEFAPPENLVPEEWVDVQKEINISKKERRKLSQRLEYGKRVEKRRQALQPLYSDEEYERFKTEKLRQLKPLVLDNPELEAPKGPEENNDKEHEGEVAESRVAPRNPRRAVYGGGLEDVSAVFNSESYEPGTGEKSQGPRKLFSKEEKALLNRRVPDLTVATSGKWNPLHTLAACGEFYLVNSLLKHNLDIHTLDMNGLTPVHRAILGKKQAVFNFLLRESANPFVRDNDGATLMHYAVFAASTPMIKILLLYNVDINLQDNDGWTPLHLAVQSRRTDVIRLLLIKGADKSIKNGNGCTALDLCLYSGRDVRTYEMIKLLKLPPKK